MPRDAQAQSAARMPERLEGGVLNVGATRMRSSSATAGDLILPLFVVAIVGMLIFPLPVPVLDVLLMCNISFSLVLLLSAVYLAQPDRFTSLPTLLLLTTLFRLGLNIATTRQILAGEGAPEIVSTFGNYVVYGNLAVGVVIFLIISVVQFVVISKGAERVAEVAARFTLDAMPGKQMAIDADVRSGILSLAEAKDKRYELQREARLYGSLDGAMKFVKGDAIAGLLITAINIIGGFFVGLLQQGLSLLDAAEKFTIYAIGDGLASQVPALLVAVGAGITVTRVADRDGGLLGRDMFGQLSREPQALLTTAVVLMVLGFVPGLPLLPFLALGAVLWICARRVRNNYLSVEEKTGGASFHAQLFSGAALRITLRAAHLLQQEGVLPDSVQKLRREVFEEWGVIIPDLQFDVDGASREISTRIMLNGVEMMKVERAGQSENSSGGKRYSIEIIDCLKEFFQRYLPELLNDTQTRMLLDLH
ncbi:MAG TPA: FHIPEP family type III secretion protein, partial [Oligoflexia bacterium]|nr:FHIPEP family type III secretion protein [Oligoflexia bacterium]